MGEHLDAPRRHHACLLAWGVEIRPACANESGFAGSVIPATPHAFIRYSLP